MQTLTGCSYKLSRLLAHSEYDVTGFAQLAKFLDARDHTPTSFVRVGRESGGKGLEEKG